MTTFFLMQVGQLGLPLVVQYDHTQVVQYGLPLVVQYSLLLVVKYGLPLVVCTVQFTSGSIYCTAYLW